jgi:hypothetical protein
MRMPRYEVSTENVDPPFTDTMGDSACANPLAGTPALTKSNDACQSTGTAAENTKELYCDTIVSIVNVAGMFNCA